MAARFSRCFLRGYSTVKPRRRTCTLAVGGVAALGAAAFTSWYLASRKGVPKPSFHLASPTLPARDELLQSLKTNEFDLLVVGGGAVGAGVALDATLRGLKVALVERNDFACETSSRSTKLLHGGIRYLEKAFTQFDASQFALVFEALRERSTVMSLAPLLCRALPIAIPCRSLWDYIYLGGGALLYSALSPWGSPRLGDGCRWISRGALLREYPTLGEDGRVLGGVVYTDGQMDDARLALLVILTAIAAGATALNHAAVTALEHDPSTGRLVAAMVREGERGEVVRVRARRIVNATGCHVDGVRALDDAGRGNVSPPPLLQASRGTHLVLSGHLSSPHLGLIVPATADGRVLFVLPWQDRTLVGTTEAPATPAFHPTPPAADVATILRALREHLQIVAEPADVLAAWTGMRALAPPRPRDRRTADIVREHVLEERASGLLSVFGGKWTTYRKIAEHVVDAVVRGDGGGAAPCRTAATGLVGGAPDADADALVAALPPDIPPDIRRHLVQAYGVNASQITDLVRADAGLAARLAPDHSFVLAEVIHAARHEYACTVVDVLARRIRLAFLDAAAARAAVPATAQALAMVHGWDPERLVREVRDAHAYFEVMQVVSGAAD